MSLIHDGAYANVKLLHSGPRGPVYAGVRVRDQLAVVLKVFAEGALGVDQARREAQALQGLDHPGIPGLIELHLDQPAPVMVLERAPGIPLLAWVRDTGDPDPAVVVDLAIRWTDCLAHVHSRRVIHRDVHPQNILVEPRSLETYLIDFGLAQPLGAAERRPAATGDPTGPVGSLQFIAPEQTGRMRRGCDARSDLYALGATLYFALTGKPPFDRTDPLELIHAHMAIRPSPPQQLRPEVPEALGRVVLKLLAKEPEERYQRALSVKADLCRLRDQLAGALPLQVDFTPGVDDTFDRPRFGGELQGRVDECEALREVLARATEGHPQIVWIQGPAGAGKSSLVETLRPRVSESSGYLISGKFDRYSERPYGGWIDALTSLTAQILVESDVHVERWGEALRPALSPIARTLVELIPDLEHILGDVEPIPTLAPRESQQRLALALDRLLSAVATVDHPLVIFLDDLQWSDSGSRFLIERILTRKRGAFVFLGAYRDEALAPGMPLPALLSALSDRRIESRTLSIDRLSLADSIAMLSTALGHRGEELRNLAEHIERKTGNLPLLIRQFTDQLYEQGLLQHGPGGEWSWDADAVARTALPEDAVALMAAKIERLAPEVREALALASCVGDQFNLALLSELSELDPEGLKKSLYELCDAGLVVPSESGLSFAHDRIREAAHSCLSDEQRTRLHAVMARLLIERTAESDRDARDFEIADHLNHGAAQVPPELRLVSIDFNRRAGSRALAAGAAPEAAAYLCRALEQLGDSDWEERRALAFELHVKRAECGVLSGDFALALSLLDALEAREPSPLEFAQIAVLRIRILVIGEPTTCARYALDALERLGLRWPLRPSRLRARCVLRLTAWRLALRARRRPDLLEPPHSPDPRWGPRLLVLGSASFLARVDTYLIALIAAFGVRLYLREGYLGPPAAMLSAFAVHSYSVLWDRQLLKQCMELARTWLKRTPDPVHGPQTQFHLAFCSCWLTSRRKATMPMVETARALGEAGEVEFQAYALFAHAYYGALSGVPIEETLHRFRSQIEDLGPADHTEPVMCLDAFRHLSPDDPEELDLDRSVERVNRHLSEHPGSGEALVRTLWMLVLCVYRREDLAFAQSVAVEEGLFRVMAYTQVADHTLYRGIAAATLAVDSRGRARRRYRRELRRALRHMDRWTCGESDFGHMRTLLQAELAALGRDGVHAAHRYRRAALEALDRGYVHNAALAYERLARLLTRWERSFEASRSLTEAILLYERWGAHAKAAALRPRDTAQAAQS